MHISSLFSASFVTFFLLTGGFFFLFPFSDDGTMEGEHASLSGGICYSNFMAEQIIKKECHSVGCWQHLSLQPCVSIKAPGPSGGLFPLLFSIPVFYLDLKWGLLKNSHLTAGGAATFLRFPPLSTQVENAAACKVSRVLLSWEAVQIGSRWKNYL